MIFLTYCVFKAFDQHNKLAGSQIFALDDFKVDHFLIVSMDMGKNM